MKKFVTFSIPLMVSLIVMFISLNNEIWINFWQFFNVPPQIPPFSDLDAISRALTAKQEGLNPYFNNPYDLKNKTYVYPSIWLHFFDLFNLNKKINFQVFNFILIYFYTFIYLKLALKINKNSFSTILSIIFLSSASLLAVERLNIEIIIFILIYFLASANSFKSQFIIYLIAVYGKLYPIFSVFIFLRNKKILYLMIFLSILLLFFVREEIFLLMKNGNEVALNIAYGVPTLTKGIWYYSTKFGYFINDENYKIFKYFMIFLASIYATCIVLIKFKFGEKFINKTISLEEKLFICGGGIFIGRFINFSNADYGLIFLVFTLPYLIKDKITHLKIFLLALIVISFNSIWFEFGDRYTYVYLGMALLVHSIKIIIFSTICFYFGKILNNYLKIKFN
ncbi:hypothetical protein N8Z31_00930 [Pelagibacteraceae bacterium]|nr:hypothetical protein [Pelagibacteraceae bacterium]